MLRDQTMRVSSRLFVVILSLLFAICLFTSCGSQDVNEQESTNGQAPAAIDADLASPPNENNQSGEEIKETPSEVAGVGVASVIINEERHLIVTLMDGTEYDAGYIGGDTSTGYAVAFFDYDDRLLKVEIVPDGGAATPPSDPLRENYAFSGWEGQIEDITQNTVVTASYTVQEPEEVEYTVTFLDYDGTVLYEERVPGGQFAHPPKVPERDGYVFAGWDGSYQLISSDTILNATYEEDTVLIIAVDSAEGKRQDTVQAAVTLENNPGIAGLLLYMDFDPQALSLAGLDYGALFEAGGQKMEPDSDTYYLLWTSTEEVSDDTTLVTLEFDILDNAEVGETYPITLWAPEGSIVNLDEAEVRYVLQDGGITILD